MEPKPPHASEKPDAASRIPATVSILTLNSARTLPRALSSVSAFAEILVNDGGSTDDTRSIALAHGARVIDQDPAAKDGEGRLGDWSIVRNQCLAASAYGWHFFLDSDEYASDALVEEIRRIVAAEVPGAYWVPRRYVYDGQEIACSIGYPNQQMRFFHKSAVTGFRKPVHERLELASGIIPQHLHAALMVPVEHSAPDARRKMERYIGIEVARQMPLSRGRAFHHLLMAGKATLRYLVRFVRMSLGCRGARLPLALEFLPLEYEWRLARRAWNEAV